MCIFSEDLQVLGHRITPTGRFPISKGTEAISAMPRPKNVSGVKRFLGMVGYFRDYVQHMSNRTKHLRALLRQGTPFVWTSAHEAEFTDLKQALLSPETMLYHPNWHSPFEQHTDASKHGVGAMLAQMHNGQFRPVKFASRSFTSTESRWPTTHQELFAIKWGLEHFRPYVLGRTITVITDHANLKFLTSIAPQQSKLVRWYLSMAEFDFVIEHRPGVDHVVPDTLSHAPLPEPSPVGDTLVLPPTPISLFLATMVGYDIPSHHPSLVSKVFSYPLDCISLASSPDPPNTWAPQPLVEPSTKLLSSQPPRQLIEEVQQKHNVPSRPLNVSQETLAKRQRADKWLGPIYQFPFSQEDTSVLSGLDKQVQTWVKANASNCKIVDDLIMYSDKLMTDPHHHRIFIPSDPDLQCHHLTAYHDSPIGMHHGRDATYNTLSQDFYWRSMHKNVKTLQH